jgi:hypothetical protein
MKWEYRTLYLEFSVIELKTKLDSFGEDGWELVSTVHDKSGILQYLLFIFKRPITN